MAASPFDLSTPRLEELKAKLSRFCVDEVGPAQVEWEKHLEENARTKGNRFASVPPVIERLKRRARELGLWNVWMPKTYLPLGAGLTNLEYAQLAEIMGRYPLASEACNCSAPDTGSESPSDGARGAARRAIDRAHSRALD